MTTIYGEGYVADLMQPEPTLRERNLAMMIRILCSRRQDGQNVPEAKREQALALLRSMGLQGSPLRTSPDEGQANVEA